MKKYSQKDTRWANKKLGSCNTTIRANGCKLCCASMIAEIRPDELNKTIPYVNGCLLADKTMFAKIGCKFLGRTTKKPKEICIMETDHFKNKGVPQHFVIYHDGKILDPLEENPDWEKNYYHVVSYRLFKKNHITQVDEKVDYITGIDISHHQGDIDWDKLETGFVIMKATQGDSYVDPKFEENRRECRERGIPCGFYHFAGRYNGKKPSIVQSAKTEVSHFINTVGELNDGEMMFLDWETDYETSEMWMYDFMGHIKDKHGKCGLYISNYDQKFFNMEADVLWIQRYKDYSGDLDWKYAPQVDWDIFQYTSRGKVKGIKGNVDINLAKPEIFKKEKPKEKPIINKPKNMLNGYKTYTGLFITFLGAIGVSKFFAPEELQLLADALVQIVGLAIAVYGRIKANK